jgi:hypothetical protein
MVNSKVASHFEGQERERKKQKKKKKSFFQHYSNIIKDELFSIKVANDYNLKAFIQYNMLKIIILLYIGKNIKRI